MKVNENIAAIGLYSIFFVTCVFVLNYFFIPGILNADHFLGADAEHYLWIKNFGYQGFRVAFFPLFPMVWKVLSFGVYGIVIFNTFLFLLSFYFLTIILNINLWETVLYLTIPSFIFFYLPYTESLFFACSTILILGLKNNKLYLVLAGLFLCTLTRPAFTVFIPALIVAEYLSEKINKKLFVKIGLYIVISLAGFFIVSMIQYHYTGEWFKFLEAQKGWGNKLQIPKFPLTTWGGGLITRLDGAAFLIGTVSGILLILYIFRFRFLNKLIIPKEVVFSLAYLAGMVFTVLIFRGGLLFSLNRFVFAVPFIIVALHYYFSLNIDLNRRHLIIGFIMIFLFYLLFASYVHIQAQLKYLFLTFYLFLIIAIKIPNTIISRISLILLIAFNIYFQIFLFIRFLNNMWVG